MATGTVSSINCTNPHVLAGAMVAQTLPLAGSFQLPGRLKDIHSRAAGALRIDFGLGNDLESPAGDKLLHTHSGQISP